MTDPIITTAEVAEHLQLPGAPDTSLGCVVDAINALLPQWVEPDRLDSPAIAHGGVMLAARVYRRRNSPAGVESLGELGPVYVSRNDPDLAMMLGLANYRRPIAM